MSSKDILHIVLAVIHKEGQVLLIKRAKPDPLVPELTWAFPGGKVREKDKYPRVSLVREVKEEVGIDIEVERYLKGRNYPDRPEILIEYYLCRPQDSEPLITSEPQEVAEIKWVEVKEVPNYLTSDIAPQVLEVLKEIEKESATKPNKETVH